MTTQNKLVLMPVAIESRGKVMNFQRLETKIDYARWSPNVSESYLKDLEITIPVYRSRISGSLESTATYDHDSSIKVLKQFGVTEPSELIGRNIMAYFNRGTLFAIEPVERKENEGRDNEGVLR